MSLKDKLNEAFDNKPDQDSFLLEYMMKVQGISYLSKAVENAMTPLTFGANRVSIFY